MSARTVMIVDDSGSVRTVVRLALQKAGYGVVEAADGEDAAGKLDGRALDAIVCDIHMPRLDGIGFLGRLRQAPGYETTPVIMLTVDAPDERRAAHGELTWFTKPFRPSALVDAVDRVCTRDTRDTRKGTLVAFPTPHAR